jgi:hypothetical protein
MVETNSEVEQREKLNNAVAAVIDLGRTTFIGEQDSDVWTTTREQCKDVGFGEVQQEILARYGQHFQVLDSNSRKAQRDSASLDLRLVRYRGHPTESKLPWMAAAMGIVEAWRTESTSE